MRSVLAWVVLGGLVLSLWSGTVLAEPEDQQAPSDIFGEIGSKNETPNERALVGKLKDGSPLTQEALNIDCEFRCAWRIATQAATGS